MKRDSDGTETIRMQERLFEANLPVCGVASEQDRSARNSKHDNDNDLQITFEAGEEIWEVPTSAPTRYLSHDYFRYIGKFPPQIPRRILTEYSSPGDEVVDPMCGGGTVLIEGRLLNRRGWGGDVNPVSVLISSVATRVLQPCDTGKEVADFLATFQGLVSSRGQLAIGSTLNSNNKRVSLPNMHGHEKYFDEETLAGLQVFFSLLETVSSQGIRDFLLVGLLSVLRSVSHANVKKMNLELDLDKKTRKTLSQALSKKYQQMVSINQDLFSRFVGQQPQVIQGAANDLDRPDNSADLGVIHPPYLSNTAFSEATQLQLAVLGISHLNIWKRELRARGSFLHEPNGVQKYIVGWNRTLQEMYRILRKGRHCAVVVGDGQVDYTRIPVGVITVELAKDIGFKLVRKASHRLNHNTGKTLSRKMRDQHILIFEK
jgi:DNA modification methylase